MEMGLPVCLLICLSLQELLMGISGKFRKGVRISKVTESYKLCEESHIQCPTEGKVGRIKSLYILDSYSLRGTAAHDSFHLAWV